MLWAEWLQKEVLEPVPHRHVVLTMPRLLRGVLRKRRELLLDLAQCAAVTDGAFSDDGAFRPLETWDADAVMKLFRERLLARLIERHAISEELARKLLAWRHPGFSAFVGDAIPFDDRKAIEDVACYIVRNPLSLKKLVYLDGQKAVLYRSRMNPPPRPELRGHGPARVARASGRPYPRPRKHRTHFYAHYANRVRGERPSEELRHQEHEGQQPKKRRCSASWARLIAKVYEADPLVCRRCGGPLKAVAYITDTVAIRRILDHLGLSPPEKPPPGVRDVVRVPGDDEGREIGASPA